MDKTYKIELLAVKLREAAAQVRENPTAREAIAAGFEAIAEVVEEFISEVADYPDFQDSTCTDCGNEQGAAIEPGPAGEVAA